MPWGKMFLIALLTEDNCEMASAVLAFSLK